MSAGHTSRLSLHLGLTTLAGALGATAVLVLSLERVAATSALLGVGVATAAGVVALLLKSRVDAAANQTAALLKAQGWVFALKLALIGLGALAVRQAHGAPVAYVLAFMALYLVQQFIEVRYMLSAQRVAGAR